MDFVETSLNPRPKKDANQSETEIVNIYDVIQDHPID